MESLRMQTRDNLERMVVIKAFIAVRVLGLRQGGVSEETQNDSKRTGRPGWVVMWDGWFRLQDMVEGYLVMKSLDQEI